MPWRASRSSIRSTSRSTIRRWVAGPRRKAAVVADAVDSFSEWPAKIVRYCEELDPEGVMPRRSECRPAVKRFLAGMREIEEGMCCLTGPEYHMSQIDHRKARCLAIAVANPGSDTTAQAQVLVRKLHECRE